MKFVVMDPDDIKRCPFCGSKAFAFFDDDNESAYVECCLCEARSKTYPFVKTLEINAGKKYAVDKAVMAWNRRDGE